MIQAVIRQHMNARDWALLIFLSMIWGASFLFMELAITGFPTLTIVAIRVSFAAASLNIYLALRRQSIFFGWRNWRDFMIMAILGNLIPFSLIVWGQIYITAGLSSILNGTVPFFTVIGVHYFTKDETLTRGKIIGLIAGFAGVITIVGPGALISGGHHVLGELAVVVASMCYAAAILFAKRFKSRGISAVSAATGQLTSAALIQVPIALMIEQPWINATPNMHAFLAIAALGIMSTALAITIYYHLLNTVGATNVSLVTFLIPVSAIFLGIMFLGETLSLNQVAGMAMIGIGLFVMNRKGLKKA